MIVNLIRVKRMMKMNMMMMMMMNIQKTTLMFKISIGSKKYEPELRSKMLIRPRSVK